MLRLLKKEEINKIKSDEKAREVAEGLKISRRVDDLRELSAKTEKETAAWRDATLSEAHKQINEAIAERDAIFAERDKVREELKNDLSKTKKEQLEALERKLSQKDKELTERSHSIDLKEIDIALTLKESNDAKVRQESNEYEAAKMKEQAMLERSEARSRLEASRRIEEDAIRRQTESENSIAVREGNLKFKEEEVVREKEELDEMKWNLEVEKKQVADQRATLERALQRLKDNRLA